MAVNHHQNKYKVLRSKSEKVIRDMAKKYGVRVPKEIKDLEKFRERVANKIEKIEYEEKAPNFERNKKLAEINKFNKQFMKEIGATNSEVKNFLDNNKKYKMEEVIEVNLVLDDFNRKKINMNMIDKFAKSVDRTSDSILEDMYNKVRAFDLDYYENILENYDLHGKELKNLYKRYNQIDLEGKAKILKVIHDFSKGMYKYVGENYINDDIDRDIAKSNLMRIIDNEFIQSKERKNRS